MNARIRPLNFPKHIYYRSFFTFRSTAPHPRSPLRSTLYATTLLVSAGLFAVYYLDARSAIHRFLATPLLRNTLDPETSHRFAVNVLKSGLAPRDPLPDDLKLKAKVCISVSSARFKITALQIWELEISNPVGLAAGFDKDGEAIDGAPLLF